MAFHVGQKVVCVDDVSTPQYIVPQLRKYELNSLDGLKKGVVYTVRGACPDNGTAMVPCIYLEEITRPFDCLPGGQNHEPGYAAIRFRPVTERKADTGALKALLVPSTKIREHA